ncbi:GloA protein [[Mannheimia] succiniciproducens MBEL55E]|uniref:GloA protein n=1 Tax=Mannheimia succiniciproducens (strain KCTC 0769BP / MBEL55E) TaxID=221988 RepID=Q65UZ2_MANSM|nr:GloA protein [[Mannheimia] succiniciproducens MBEL55E]
MLNDVIRTLPAWLNDWGKKEKKTTLFDFRQQI